MEQINVALRDLFVSPLNVRKTLDAGEEDSGVAELAESISTHGLLSPLIVRRSAGGRFEILAGQRRFHACQMIVLDPVCCLVRESVDDNDAMTLSLVENVQRAEMHALDKAKALKGLYERYGSYEQVARKTGWRAPTISKHIRLLQLPEALQQRISTANGAANVGVLSRLAASFSGDDAIDVYDRISGFTGSVQDEILKQAKGDITIIADLVDEAHEGVFDVRRCGGSHGCEIVRDILGKKISQAEFERTVEEAATRIGSTDLEFQRLKNAAWNFWKALAVGDGRRLQ